MNAVLRQKKTGFDPLVLWPKVQPQPGKGPLAAGGQKSSLCFSTEKFSLSFLAFSSFLHIHPTFLTA